jgi:maltose alpha-D-glucosyltransferase/alpha-amylase
MMQTKPYPPNSLEAAPEPKDGAVPITAQSAAQSTPQSSPQSAPQSAAKTAVDPVPDPAWYRDAVIYEVRVRSFHDGNDDGIGDFRGLAGKLDYLQELGVDTLWLLPFYPSPLRDDGYDISHYTEVHPDLGTLEDFKVFLAEAHRRGLRVITELVLNHTSDAHDWFQRARTAPKGSPEREFYVWSDTADKYADARIIFKDFERSNWSWDPVAEAYYWHRFFSHQPDLNFDNPAVWKALFACVDFWLELGVDGLRLDAVPYLFEREGTTCENLPETIEFLRHLRSHMDAGHPGRMLLAEANQWPEDSVRYLEGGDKCHMAFHFPVMPRMYLALHAEDRFPIVDILAQTPVLHESCQWALFLRNHDELTLEMVTDEERDYLYEAYAKEPKMRLNLGIRRRLAPLLGNDRRKLELLNCLLFSLPGTPVLYYGDEIGMGENVHLADRNGVRTPMQWSPDRNAGFSGANPQSLYLPVIVDPEFHYETVNVETQQANPNSLLWWHKRLIALRKRYQAFGRGSFEMLHPENHRILAFIREYGDEKILVIMNLSRFAQYAETDLSRFAGAVPVELFGNTVFPAIGGDRYPFTLGPHMVLWFSLTTARPVGAAADRQSLPVLQFQAHELFQGNNPDFLAKAIAAYLPHCRWYSGKGRILKSLRAIPCGSLSFAANHAANQTANDAAKEAAKEAVHAAPALQTALLLTVRCEYEDGSGEEYFLPIAALGAAEAGEAESRAPGSAIARISNSPPGRAVHGLLVDALALPGFCASLYARVVGTQRIGGEDGRALGVGLGESGLRAQMLQAVRTAESEAALSDPGAVRILTGQQSNTSVVFGSSSILKIFRRLEAGINPDLEISRFLTERAGYAHSPRVIGWLDLRMAGAEWSTLGMLQEFVPDARDAWTHAREELFKFFERALAAEASAGGPIGVPEPSPVLADRETPEIAKSLAAGYLASAELLGTRTAELHLALGQDLGDPRFAPELYGGMHQRSVFQSMRNLALKGLRHVRQRLSALPPDAKESALELLANEKQVLSILEDFRRTPITATRMRHHGDLHLGQVLYTGKDFLILDFEGEPMRPLADRLRKRSPLRDVAGMIRSFHYASVAALFEQSDSGVLRPADRGRLEEWGRRWYHWASSAYLRSYLKTAGGAHFIPKDPRELDMLLRVFLLEKALYEISYELNNRPGWAGIPLRGIRDILAR